MLSQLALNDEERQLLSTNLESIIQFIEEMNKVSTESVNPLSHPVESNHELRVDRVEKDVEREQVLSIAPNVEDGLFLVPKVIEQRGS